MMREEALTIRPTLCYPLSATLVLLFAILNHPTDEEAEANLNSIGRFVNLLQFLQKRGCDVHEMLRGCSRLLSIVAYQRFVVLGRHWSHSVTPTNPQVPKTQVNVSKIHGPRSFKGRLIVKSLRMRLSEVSNWMHVAQGFLSNIACHVDMAERTFSEVLGEWKVMDGYGRFVPDVLKTYKYNFRYGL